MRAINARTLAEIRRLPLIEFTFEWQGRAVAGMLQCSIGNAA
jgi:hypothetical protein